jgi:hypothetical protein
VKDVKERFVLGKDLTLDYNTQLKIENWKLKMNDITN